MTGAISIRPNTLDDVSLAKARKRLVQYLTQWTGDADRAEDIAQNALVRLVEENPPDLRSADAWLFRVATNLARDQQRADSRHAQLRLEAEDTLTPQRLPDPERTLESSEIRAIVQRALATLPDHYRTALLMREQGFKHREIAEAIDTSTNAVGMIISRAVKQLAAALPPREHLQ